MRVYKWFYPPNVHVYMDTANASTLLQMVNFVQQSPKTPKIIAWNLYRNLSDKMDLDTLNTIEIHCLPTRFSQELDMVPDKH